MISIMTTSKSPTNSLLCVSSLPFPYPPYTHICPTKVNSHLKLPARPRQQKTGGVKNPVIRKERLQMYSNLLKYVVVIVILLFEVYNNNIIILVYSLILQQIQVYGYILAHNAITHPFPHTQQKQKNRENNNYVKKN